MRPAEDIATRIKHGLHLGRALRVVWQSAPGLTAANMVLIAIQGMLPLLALYLIKLIVDGVTAGIVAPDKAVAFWHVAFLIVLAGLVALFNSLCSSLAEVIRETQSQVITDYVSDVIHAKSVEVDLEYYEDPKYHDTLHRAQQEASFRPTRILSSLMQFGRSGISLVALAGLLFAFHWAVAVILFAATVPGVFLRLKYANRMYRWQRQRTETERRALYFHWMLTDSDHAKEIRLFGLGPLVMGWFRDLRKRLREERLKITTRRSFSELVTQASSTCAIFGTLAFITYQAVRGLITIGDMVMYYGAFQRAQAALHEILSSLTGLYEDNLFLSNYNEFLDLRPRVVEPSAPTPFPRRLKQGITFSQVTFKYPTGEGIVLEDINLHIEPGKVVALVGENGSGKTTLIKLLCRLYDPLQGHITVDGIDLRQFALAALRREISVIFQDYVHYNLTARENIWLGNIHLNPHDDRIVTAARQTGADHFLSRLPRAYETILGHWFENEGELSTGEWQKVALARAFLREAQVTILDEPTSWMDAEAEYEVFKSFRQLLNGRTAILISHRFSTVRLADYIYVLAGGKLIENGTHHELIQLGGRYAHLFELQAQSFR
jgi:ATP-binding cassette subfamily B protein